MTIKAKPQAFAKALREPISEFSNAPFVFFDAAPAHGYLNGMIMMTLCAETHVPDADGVVHIKPTVVAYLRTNVLGALHLRDGLNAALSMAMATRGSPPN